MQPHVCAQPHVRVIVIDVKCCNIIQPQHVNKMADGQTIVLVYWKTRTEESQKIA